MCRQDTKHFIIATRDTTELVYAGGGEDDYFPIASNVYSLLECCGCETVCFRHENTYFPDECKTIRYYPPPLSRPIPRWTYSIPDDLSSLLLEVYAALAADSRRLAAMGARTCASATRNDAQRWAVKSNQ